LFGNLFSNNKDSNEKTEKKVEPKKPFIFSYGRPQYDWVKGKTTRVNSGAVTWYTNLKSTKPPPKKWKTDFWRATLLYQCLSDTLNRAVCRSHTNNIANATKQRFVLVAALSVKYWVLTLICSTKAERRVRRCSWHVVRGPSLGDVFAFLFNGKSCR
jgi:hypothetical protein